MSASAQPGFDYEVYAPVPQSAFLPPSGQRGEVRLDLQGNVVSASLDFGHRIKYKLAGLRTLGRTSEQEDARATLDLLHTLPNAALAKTWASKVQLFQVVHTKGSRQVSEPVKASVVDGSLQFDLEASDPVTVDGKKLGFVYLFRELDKVQAYVHFTQAGQTASVLLFSERGGSELFKDVRDASDLKKASHKNLHVVGAAAFYAQAMRLTK